MNQQPSTTPTPTIPPPPPVSAPATPMSSIPPVANTPPPIGWPSYEDMSVRHSRGPVVIIGGVVTLLTALVISGVTYFTIRDTNKQVDEAVASVIDAVSPPTPSAPAVVAPAVEQSRDDLDQVEVPAEAPADEAAEEPAEEPAEASASADEAGEESADEAGEVIVDESVGDSADDQPAVTVPAFVPVDLLRGAGAADVVEEIRVARGAETLRILNVRLYEGYAFAQVQNPAAPDEVDEYEWRGGVDAPAPVHLIGDGDLEANLFDHTEVVWSAIPALVEAAPGLLDISDGAVSHVSVERNLPFTADVRIRVFVSGARASGFVDADTAGNVINVVAG